MTLFVEYYPLIAGGALIGISETSFGSEKSDY